MGCYASIHALAAVVQDKIPAFEFAGMTIATRKLRSASNDVFTCDDGVCV